MLRCCDYMTIEKSIIIHHLAVLVLITRVSLQIDDDHIWKISGSNLTLKMDYFGWSSQQFGQLTSCQCRKVITISSVLPHVVLF